MKNFIVKYSDFHNQSGKVNKLIGNVTLRSFTNLITNSELHANPRTAKNNNVTSEIEGSLKTSPELFHFKTKGLLFAAKVYRKWIEIDGKLVFKMIKEKEYWMEAIIRLQSQDLFLK